MNGRIAARWLMPRDRTCRGAAQTRQTAQRTRQLVGINHPRQTFVADPLLLSSTDARPDTGAPRPRPIEVASRDEIESLQLERLRWSLRHAYDHVDSYRRRFDEASVHPDDCRALDDLTRFPLTTKEHLRETYPFGMFAVPLERVIRLHAS